MGRDLPTPLVEVGVVERASVIGGTEGVLVLLDVVVLLNPVGELVDFLLALHFLHLGLPDERVVEQIRPAQTGIRILIEQTLEQVLEVALDGLRVPHWILADVLDQCEQIGSTEGRRAGRQLVQYDA